MEGDGHGTFQTRNSSLRVTCGNCHRPFSIPTPAPYRPSAFETAVSNKVISCLSAGSAPNTSLLIAARCPQCRKVTSVGQAYARVKWTGYFILSLIFLAISIIVSVSTSKTAETQHGLYFLWSGELFLFLGMWVFYLTLNAVFRPNVAPVLLWFLYYEAIYSIFCTSHQFGVSTRPNRYMLSMYVSVRVWRPCN